MMRRMAANAAAFGATLMNAVAGVGAPSYALAQIVGDTVGHEFVG
jgi:hypothetical protein